MKHERNLIKLKYHEFTKIRSVSHDVLCLSEKFTSFISKQAVELQIVLALQLITQRMRCAKMKEYSK